MATVLTIITSEAALFLSRFPLQARGGGGGAYSSQPDMKHQGKNHCNCKYLNSISDNQNRKTNSNKTVAIIVVVEI